MLSGVPMTRWVGERSEKPAINSSSTALARNKAMLRRGHDHTKLNTYPTKSYVVKSNELEIKANNILQSCAEPLILALEVVILTPPGMTH